MDFLKSQKLLAAMFFTKVITQASTHSQYDDEKFFSKSGLQVISAMKGKSSYRESCFEIEAYVSMRHRKCSLILNSVLTALGGRFPYL